MKPISEARSGHPLYAGDINAQSAELRRQGNVSFEGGSINSEGGGVHITMDGKKGFWARLGLRFGYQYAWEEVQKDAHTGSWTYANSIDVEVQILAKSSAYDDYALEINNNLGVPTNSIVWLIPETSFVRDGKTRTIYVFAYNEMGGSAITQEVVTNIFCDSNGINLTKNFFAAYNFNTLYSPTILGCTDVIPKSLSGQKNRVLTVNSTEDGFEFGAAVQGMSGTGDILASIASLNSSVAQLTIFVNKLQESLVALQNSIT